MIRDLEDMTCKVRLEELSLFNLAKEEAKEGFVRYQE